MARNKSTPAQDVPTTTGSDLAGRIRDAIQHEIDEREGTSPDSVMEEVSASRPSLFRRDLLWRVKTVSMRTLAAFTRELTILLRAGVPLLYALQSIGSRMHNEKLRDIVYRIGVMVENGDPFWLALSKFRSVFSRLYVNTVKSGEFGGHLDDVLAKLAEFLEREGMLRRKIWGAMIYPAIVVLLGVAVCVFLTTQTIPVFIDLMRDFDADLPLVTELVVKAVELLPRIWYLFVFLPVIAIVGYRMFVRTYPGRLLMDRLLLTVPIVGHINKKIAAARFARTFAILEHSGCPILPALAIVRETIGNEVAALEVDKLKDGVESGQSLETAIKDSRAFPPLLIDMLVVGEQSGGLDTVLPQIADIYEEEVSITMANIGTIIEPALILIMALFVGIVFTAFFVPYINLLTAAVQM